MKHSLAVLFAALLLAGCMKTATTGTPPAAPTPPQVTVANTMLALSHSLNGATDALIACRQQAKCSQEDVSAAESVMTAIATTGKLIDAELVSADPWATQKTKILSLVAGSGVGQLKARVSPSTQLIIAAVVTLFDNVSLAVGGPTF